LQLDVIDRTVTLWSNPGERVLTPFMGVGSEVFGAVEGGRVGIGIELKPSYYRQSIKNMELAGTGQEQTTLFNVDTLETFDDDEEVTA
jgi:DNA modification methylase